MKTRKKIISGIMSGVMALTLAAGLSGCGGKNDNTLTWYMFGDEPADLAMVMEKANEIVEPKIGMKLEMKYIDSASYKEKMKLKMASGEAFDLAFTGFIMPYQECVDLGGLYDITALVDEAGLKDIVPQTFLDSAKVDGKIYGVPNVQVVSNPTTLQMDKDKAEAAGIDVKAIEAAAMAFNKTGDMTEYTAQLDDAFAKMKAAYPDQYALNPTSNLFVDAYESITTGVLLRKDGSSTKFVRAIDVPEYKHGITKLHEWYTKGYIRNDIATAGNAPSSKEEKAKVAIVRGSWKPGQDPSIAEEYSYGTPAYAMLSEPYIGRTSALLTMISVGANTKHPKETVDFLKLINTDKELYNLLCFGIEGVHYSLNENNKVVVNKDSGYDFSGYTWCFGNQFNALLMEGQEGGVWEETEKMNDEATPSPMLGFVPDFEPVISEVTNITSVNAEFLAKTTYGIDDPAQWWDDYVKKLEQAGIDKVLAEMQKQYDEFLASKN